MKGFTLISCPERLLAGIFFLSFLLGRNGRFG